MAEFKEFLDKARKLQSRLNQICEFGQYELDEQAVLKSKEVQELVQALKLQQHFLWETEQQARLWALLRVRLENFLNQEGLEERVERVTVVHADFQE